jgi:hypothetical protein
MPPEKKTRNWLSVSAFIGCVVGAKNNTFMHKYVAMSAIIDASRIASALSEASVDPLRSTGDGVINVDIMQLEPGRGTAWLSARRRLASRPDD